MISSGSARRYIVEQEQDKEMGREESLPEALEAATLKRTIRGSTPQNIEPYGPNTLLDHPSGYFRCGDEVRFKTDKELIASNRYHCKSVRFEGVKTVRGCGEGFLWIGSARYPEPYFLSNLVKVNKTPEHKVTKYTRRLPKFSHITHR